MPPDGQQQGIGTTVTEVSERVSVLVREEIELAKAEVTQKLTRLIRGAVVGIAAGVFVVTAVLFFLHGLAWLAWYELFGNKLTFFWGFIIVGGALLLLGALAGFIATRALRSGSPPTPDMAIEEAKRIRETVTSDGGS